MRTNIDIDDKLMKAAMKATGATTKKAAVEAALRKVVQLKKQERILRLFGKVQWEGDLDAMRESRFPEWHGLPDKPLSKQADEDAA
ncbi:type II toxin-antitoxin system VapB family antitoxin [Occallatibacter riparius]|uniref:Type II toxin-antitoxin system VapB family antitoxin n=1 Tax=Occallatibacter riparius TaxID=1002689 RepID=A0A9J7BQ59_9BACT|nr:type II toxin-antitoxin system VapB family antitoxin [Occallatibacter riparius]UWZ83882.1 type II toxin-antitoxin system VapB family antitoxin [Occallatibacter riparius]